MLGFWSLKVWPLLGFRLLPQPDSCSTTLDQRKYSDSSCLQSCREGGAGAKGQGELCECDCPQLPTAVCAEL